MELGYDFYALAGFIISIPFLLVMRTIYKEDTSVESSFFTIDTARTLRFVFGYLILLEVGVVGFVFTFPYLLLGILLLLGALIIFAFNLLLAVFTLFLILVTLGGGGGFQMGGFEIFDFIFNSLFPWILVDIIYDPSLVVGIFTLYTISPMISGYNLGKYVESRKSASLTELSWHMILLNISFLLAYFDPMGNNPAIYFGLFSLHWIISRIAINRAFAWKDKVGEYNLPDIIQYKRAITLIFGVIGLGLIGTLYFAYLDLSLNDLSNPFLIFQKVLLVVPGIFVGTFGFLFFFRGDHPLDIRIDEIDTREDLLELAKEFRELDPSKMDEYMRKRDSQIRYI